MVDSIQANLRNELRTARHAGVISDFALRPHGRSTIYLADGGKVYTTGTLDTLRVLAFLAERQAEQGAHSGS